MTLAQALQYLVSGGAVAVGTALLSWLAEAWPAFKGWSNEAGKQAVFVAVPVALAVGAVAVQQFVPGAVLAALQPYFAAALIAGTGALAGKWWHENVNKANPPAKPVP